MKKWIRFLAIGFLLLIPISGYADLHLRKWSQSLTKKAPPNSGRHKNLNQNLNTNTNSSQSDQSLNTNTNSNSSNTDLRGNTPINGELNNLLSVYILITILAIFLITVSVYFTLPNGAKRSPDAAWIKRERWEALTEKEQQGFAPICPDFVAELRSPDDSLSTLQAKIVEYIENGAQLGLLFDPKTKRVYAYRPEQPMETIENPEAISGDPILTGFILNLKDI